MKRFLALALLSTVAVAQVTPVAPALTVVLNWPAPTTYTDGTAIASGTVITYNVYEYGAGVWAKLNTAPVTTPTYTVSTGIVSGQTYNFHVTSVTPGGLESGASNSATKAFAAAPFSPITGLTAK